MIPEMNKQCYRVVFNKARGMMMVVSEVTKSQNKKAGNSSGKKSPSTESESHSGVNVSYHRLALAILCCQSMVYTQVQAANSQIQNTASNVPAAQRAALLKATNGTPIVNIRTPNSNGLSHNTYNQFDIGSNGAILNNSIGGANTQLAGAIAGNQYLAKNAANTILNEVRSNAPAKFQGNLEIAGQRADVIIASPSGLQIQGGGFINANRATLTTGTPKIDSAGNLTGFDVKQGQIQFDKALDTVNALGGALYNGKNKNQANYVDVLARAVIINGKIFANQEVSIVSGSNTVDYDTGEATKITGTGAAPTLAVDVSKLGGIYAGSINLIGTENGLGVRNAGRITAGQQIVLTNSGRIENSGSILTDVAQTSLLSINTTGTTGSIEHSGTIGSYGMIDMQADKDILLNGGIIRKENPGTTTQLMPDILRMDAAGDLKMSNTSDVRNFTIVDDEANIYLHSGRDTYVDSQSIVGSNGGISIEADRFIRLLDGSNTFSRYAPLTVHSKNGTLVDNSKVTSRGDLHISASKTDNAKTADTVIRNNSRLQAQKGLTVSGERDAYIKSGSSIAGANEFALQAGRNAVIDNAGSIKVTNDAVVQAGELAYLKDSIQPITIGKQLTIEGKQATVLNSTANATNGIYITSQGKATTITNSTLNSAKGAVTAVANQAVLNVNKLTTNANSTILAAGNNVGITASNLKADNIVIESGATTTINGLTTAAKDTKQIGGTSISSKVNTSVINSTLNSAGNTVMRSDKSLTLTNNDIQSQGIVLKTNTASTLKNTAGINNTFGDGDITLTKNKLSTNGTSEISNGIIVDAANYLNVIDSQTKSTGSTSLKSGNLMRLNNSDINSGKHLTIDSKNQLITNGERLTEVVGTIDKPIAYQGPFTGNINKLQADEIISINTGLAQVYQNTDITGGAVILNSESILNLNQNTNISTIISDKFIKNTTKLSNGKMANTLNGDLIVSSTITDLIIDPRNINLDVEGDITLTARGGKLHLKGYAETQGLRSGKALKIMTSGDINLSGKEVIIEGSSLESAKVELSKIFYGGMLQPPQFEYKTVPTGGINITATDGSVELKGIKNSFSNSVSSYKIETIEKQIRDAELSISENIYDQSILDGANKFYGFKKPTGRYVPAERYVKDQKGLDAYTATKAYIEAENSKENKEKFQNQLIDLRQVLEISKKASTGFEHQAVSLTGGKDINITAKQGVLIEGGNISSSTGSINIIAEGNLASTTIVGTDLITEINKTNVNNDSIRITGLADIYQQGDIKGVNYSYHQLINQPELKAKGNIKISGYGNLVKSSDKYDAKTKAYITNNAVILNSADVISTNGDVLIDAARGDINLEASQVAFLDGSQTTSTSRSWYGKKKTKTTTKTSENSNAVTTDIQANNITLNADGNIRVYGSELAANASTGQINLKAGDESYIYAVENIDKNTTDVKKRSSWLGVRYNKEHTNDTRQELSQLPAKLVADSTHLESGGNTVIQGAIFNSNSDNIQVGVGTYADVNAKLILTTVTNQITTTHNQEKESTVWQKTVEKRDTVTTAQLPKFNQTPTMTGPDGKFLNIEIPVDVDISDNNEAKLKIQQSQKELGKIALNLSKQPGYEYLAELDKNNEINWAQVNLIQEHYEFEQEGLTAGAAALIALAIAVASGGAGTGASASLVAANAAGTALQTQAVLTLINNKGDLGKTFKDMAHSDTIRNMATAALTAGTLQYMNTSVMPGVFKNLSITDLNSLQGRLVNGVFEGTTSALITTGINGGSLSDNLELSLLNSGINAAHGFAASEIKTTENNYILHKVLHAVAGCASAAAKKADCTAGAIGASVGEVVAELLPDPNMSDDYETYKAAREKQLFLSQFIAGTIATVAGYDAVAAIDTAQTAVANNRQFKQREVERIKQLAAKNSKASEADYFIAGCALIKCSAHLPVDSIEYKAARKIEIQGATAKYASLRTELSAQIYESTQYLTNHARTSKEKLFEATPTTDKASKFNSTYQIGTRAEGVFITAVGTGSGAISAAGLSTCATGIGCALAGSGLLYSSDIMSTGLRQAYSGKTENTLGAQALNEVLNIPLSTAEMVYSAAGVAGEISAIRSGLKLAASTNKVTIPVNAGQGNKGVSSKVLEMQATQKLLNEIDAFPSINQATKTSTMIGAYDPVTGKIAVGKSGPIKAENLDPKTVFFLESKLGVKIGELTGFCKNSVGICAEVNAADQLVRQGSDPSRIKFTQALIPRVVKKSGIVNTAGIKPTCNNCKITWPTGTK